MKALILAGGKGTRLRPLTHSYAKHLIPVANKPIIFYGLEQIKAVDITDIGIVISDQTGPDLRSALGDGNRWGVKITYILQKQALGLAHAVTCAHGFLSNEDFLLFLGDNILQDGLKKLKDTFNTSSLDALIVVKQVSNPCQFGVAELNSDGKVIHVVEKPEHPQSDLALVGAYIFTPAIHRAIARIQPSKRGEYEITDAIQMLISMGNQVHTHLLQGWWLDTGRKDDLLEANRLILRDWMNTNIRINLNPDNYLFDKVEILENSTINNCFIRGPVSIGENCRITNSNIDPYASIGANTVVENSNIDNSIIMSNAEITNIQHLTQSIIGRNTRIVKNANQQNITRLFLGDDNVVEL
jgi:glucose-1-phosphate thymidylyltransferase